MNTKRLALTTLALAAAGAAGTAGAQSSVTLYGVADAFYQFLDGDDDSLNRLQSGGLNGSRLGVRGTEDLGGGLKALFQLETGINIDDGTTGQGGVFWGRQAWVGLGSDWGNLKLGRQYGSVYDLTDQFSAFSNGSLGASTAVIGGFGPGGLYEPVRGSGAGTATVPISSGTGAGGPARVNNSVKYETPNWAGFRAGALFGFGEVGDVGDNRVADVYARYTAGPFDAMISYMEDKRQAAVGPPLAPEIHTRQIGVGGAFTFLGAYRIMGGYLKVDDRETNLDGDGWWLGGDARFGPHLIRAQYVGNRPDPSDTNTDAYGIGYQYDFSKRTAFYTSLNYYDNEDNVARYNSSVPAGIVTLGSDTSITEFLMGVRHSF
jgi:predicted porin